MRPFVILTDSTCDLRMETLQQRQISYVTMGYTVDGTEYPARLDWQAHTPQQFYDYMRAGKRITTTQVSAGLFSQTFRAYLAQGQDVVYLGCSSALSGSVNTARVVAQSLREEYPQGQIYCVDTLISSLGQGALCLWAAALRDAGTDAAAVAQTVQQHCLQMNQCGTVEDLEYLRRSGRVTASSAFFGNIFGVKPILISDRLGRNVAIKKVKGAANARAEIAAQIAQAVEQPQQQTLFVSHADAQAQAQALAQQITDTVPFKDVYINTIAPIVGASVGPGTIIAFCFGKEVQLEGGN